MLEVLDKVARENLDLEPTEESWKCFIVTYKNHV
jgi:hypothetical protein